MKIKINVNNSVRVKLTDEGREIHKKDHERVFKGNPKFPYRPPVEDAEGYSRWLIWNLMQTFGPYIYLGMVMPFDTDILYEYDGA